MRNVVAVAFPVLLLSTPALARSTVESPYAQSDVFASAVRFVRIDRGCHVTDKDGDSAYISFECKDGERTTRGGLEIFRNPASGGVRVQVTLSDEGRGYELRFLELFERKLREELGVPVKKSPPPPPPDGGAPK